MLLSWCLQDEKALYGAADRGDVSAVRRLLASNVNINCTPYPEVQCDCVPSDVQSVSPSNSMAGLHWWQHHLVDMLKLWDYWLRLRLSSTYRERRYRYLWLSPIWCWIYLSTETHNVVAHSLRQGHIKWQLYIQCEERETDPSLNHDVAKYLSRFCTLCKYVVMIIAITQNVFSVWNFYTLGLCIVTPGWCH